MDLKIKRVYEHPAPGDGERILVDRLWPRGLTKQAARVDLWLKDIAPSPDLRKWFAHDPARWEEFKSRYREELNANNESITALRHEIENGDVTLVYGARDEAHNGALVILECLQHMPQ